MGSGWSGGRDQQKVLWWRGESVGGGARGPLRLGAEMAIVDERSLGISGRILWTRLHGLVRVACKVGMSEQDGSPPWTPRRFAATTMALCLPVSASWTRTPLATYVPRHSDAWTSPFLSYAKPPTGTALPMLSGVKPPSTTSPSSTRAHASTIPAPPSTSW